VLVGRNTSKLQEVKDSLIGEGHSVLAGDVGSPEFWGKVRRQEVRYPPNPIFGKIIVSVGMGRKWG
jgi:hypothetical protein